MQYLRGWRALRKDPEWKQKIGIISLILLTAGFIPILGQLVMIGWGALAMRRAVSGQESPLPRLDFDFEYMGKLLGVGFRGFLASLLWTFPVVLVTVLSVFCLYGSIAYAVLSGSSEEDAKMIVIVALVAMFVLLPLVSIFLAMPAHVAMMRAELSDDLSAALRFKEVMGTTRLLFKELLVGSFVMMMIRMCGLLLGLATCFIGLFPAAAILYVIDTYWKAELYRVYLEKGGMPLAIGPLEVALPARPASQPAAG